MNSNPRDTVFVSHANPEDDAFALWLTLKLANEGYRVWCDRAQLLGGEQFWPTAESALRDHTAKFLFVLTHHSNDSARGTFKELQLAETLKRQMKTPNFIIPLRLDDLRPADDSVLLQGVQSILFRNRWGPGLAELLVRLAKDSTPKLLPQGGAAVSSWWRDHMERSDLVLREHASCSSNWLPVQPPEADAYVHLLRDRIFVPEPMSPPVEAEYPVVYADGRAVSFCGADVVSRSLPYNVEIAESQPIAAESLWYGEPAGRLLGGDNPKRILAQMINSAWDKHAKEMGLLSYMMASGAACSYFPKGLVAHERLEPTAGSACLPMRVAGKFTKWDPALRQKTPRSYHFGVAARAVSHPTWLVALWCHVLFSDDGRTIWQNTRSLQSARRKKCSRWYNSDWRDRLLLTARWLAGGKDSINLPVAPNAAISVSPTPVQFESDFTIAEARMTDAVDVEESSGIEDSNDLPEDGGGRLPAEAD